MNEVDDYKGVIEGFSSVHLKNPTIIVGFNRYTPSSREFVY